MNHRLRTPVCLALAHAYNPGKVIILTASQQWNGDGHQRHLFSRNKALFVFGTLEYECRGMGFCAQETVPEEEDS